MKSFIFIIMLASLLALSGCSNTTDKGNMNSNGTTTNDTVSDGDKDDSVVDDMGDAAEDVTDGVADGVKDTVEGAAKGVKDMGNGVKNGVDKMTDSKQ